MKLNFRKISAIASSVLMIGMTAGVAAAANYPAPLVQGGVADVAIVYGTGTGVSQLDAIQAGNIQTDLQASMGTSTTTSASVTGEAVSLSSGSTKIWLNTSLSTALTTLTKSDLPTVLGAYTFSGNVDSKLTSTITVGSNKVTFAKQPSSNDDPVIGITTSTSSGSPLYTAAITMPAIAFNDTDSEGETIHLFGKDFVVSTSTDNTDLVLFSSAEEVSLSIGGTNPSSQTVTIDGTSYTIELITGSSTTSATISVNGVSKAISTGNSKKINGLDVALKSVTESTALSKIDATVLVGSQKITFTNNTQVTTGSDDDPVDGTLVTFTGNTGALTGLSVAVYAPDTSNNAILAGESFEDPVFGSFKVDFTGLNVPLDSDNRDTIKIDKSGDKGMSLTFTDSDSNTNTFDFVYNTSGSTFLGDSNSYLISVLEGASLNENNYTMIGNEDYGHLIQVTRIYNNTATDYSKDAVTFKDIMSGDTYSMDATGEGTGRLTIDGRQYSVTYSGTGDTGTVTLKYPTSDSSSTQYVVFPTIQTKNGALVSLYKPQTISLNSTLLTALMFPNGDGYAGSSTGSVLAYTGGINNTWTIGSASFNTGNANATTANLTVGKLKYAFIGSTSTANSTTIKLYQPDTGTLISAPGVVVFEGKDDSSNYEAIVIDVESAAAGTSSNPLGVNDVYFTSPTIYPNLQLHSDSDVVKSVDLFGTEVTEDTNTASQKIVTISYPKEQVYAQVYVAEEAASITAGTSGTGTSGAALGEVLVKDTEVSSVATKNLVIVGGSCINSAAASVLGGSYCGSAFTTATGVGSGQFLIKGYTGTSETGRAHA